MAVVATGELHHPVPAGRTAGEADDRHGRLGSRRHETDLVATGHRLGDHLGQTDLAFGRGTVGRAARRCLGDGRDHGRMGVAQDGRSPGLDVVEQPPAVDVLDKGTLGAGDEVRRPAHRVERPHWRVDAAGDHPAGLGEQL